MRNSSFTSFTKCKISAADVKLSILLGELLECVLHICLLQKLHYIICFSRFQLQNSTIGLGFASLVSDSLTKTESVSEQGKGQCRLYLAIPYLVHKKKQPCFIWVYVHYKVGIYHLQKVGLVRQRSTVR